MAPGKLIVFEGCDKTGKSTQAKLLATSLGNKAEYMCFPNRNTPIGRMLSEFLLGSDMDDRVAHLLFSANRWEVCGELKSKLDSGVHVILDRYKYSGTVFSVARGVDTEEWCSAPDRGLPEPDVVLLFNNNDDSNMSREDFGEERLETHAIQTAAKQLFLNMAKRNPKTWRIIDGTGDVATVTGRVQRAVKDVI